MSSNGQAGTRAPVFRLASFLAPDEARRVRSLPPSEQRIRPRQNGIQLQHFYRASALVPGIPRDLDRALVAEITHEYIDFLEWLVTIPTRHQRDAAVAYRANPARARAYWAAAPWERVLFHDREPRGIHCLNEAHELYRGVWLFLNVIRDKTPSWVALHLRQFAAPAFTTCTDPRPYDLYWTVSELIEATNHVPKLPDLGYCFGKKPKL